ncbi:hypothetical protein C8R46DRAFT_439183 [Mycena filopes]|nr:hypothetical protein C8R46DRAFT_439183 [Mycena filopes]
MRFIYATIAAALVQTAASSAVPAVIEARVAPALLERRVIPSTNDCIEYGKLGVGHYDGPGGNFSAACAQLSFGCTALNGTSLWSHPLCVAAATCQGTRSVIILNQCQNHNVAHAAAIPNLAAAIYGSIVGSCSATGCPITQQNYIDFIYGQMSAVNVTQWPDLNSVVLAQWWKPITTWTATGNSIPYSNFNDWLHYSETDVDQ